MTTEERESKSAQWRTDNLGKNVGLANVVKKEADVIQHSELAFCSSAMYDFDNCPLIKQTNDCKNCRWYVG